MRTRALSRWMIIGIVMLINILRKFTISADYATHSTRNKVSSATSEGDINSLNLNNSVDLFGIRIESEVSDDEGFIGYSDKGVSIVRPNAAVRVVLFGNGLDKVAAIGFTINNTCRHTVANITSDDFVTQQQKRLVIKHSFPHLTSIVKICLLPRPVELDNGEKNYRQFIMVDDLRCAISTNIPPKKHYFPLFIQIVIIIILLSISGLFSGLALGLMALTPQELMLISKSGSDKERIYAEAILPVRKNSNLLLCSILIGNVIVNSSISILFDDLTTGYIALIISSVTIVIFGEILPQAICVKKGLAVGARTIWITRFIIVLAFPVAYPLSKALDWMLGEEVVSYDRRRLMEMIKLTTRHEEGLAEELKIAVGAMEINDKTVVDVMTKIGDVFMLPDTTVLNTKTVAEILRMGYTRIPIYSGNRNNIVSMLFVKDLALLDPDDNFTVKTICSYHKHTLRFVDKDTPLRVMLEEFKKGDYHLAFVQRQKNTPNCTTEDSTQSAPSKTENDLIGIVTLEDIIEEILQAEIVDESDAITDNVRKIRRRRTQELEFNFFNYEQGSSTCTISLQMQLVTYQWLTSNHKAFQSHLISKSVLERVIQQNVHKLEITHLTDLKDPKMVFPRASKLYSKKQPSEKFVLILEGRAFVTIGQTEMTFEAGPWYCFGKELLDKLILLVGQTQSAVEQRLIASAPLDGVDEDARLAEFDTKKVAFMPDFSAVIRDSCTYLEITADTYLLAYKSTLISKNRPLQQQGNQMSYKYTSSGSPHLPKLTDRPLKAKEDTAEEISDEPHTM